MLLKLAMRQNRRVFSVLVLAASMVAASVWSLWFAHLLGARLSRLSDYVLVTSFNMVFALIARVFFVSFMLNSLLQDITKDAVPEARPTQALPGASPTPAPPAVEILGRRFRSGDLWRLAAEQHYVSVGTQDGKSVLLRGNMSDAVAVLPPDLGVQVHRSHWVARAAISTVKRSSKGWRVVLLNGIDVPVARPRQSDVAQWIETTDSTKAP